MPARNVTIERQSFGDRICGSLFAAFVLAPLLILLSVLMLGWNEKNDVCSHSAIYAGQSAVVEPGCSGATTSDGELVTFACILKKDGLKPLSPPSPSDFDEAIQVVGTGLSTRSEMLQCVQEKTSETRKTSGGGSETVTTYQSKMAWSSSHVDSSEFRSHDPDGFRENCGGVQNPPWPTGLPPDGAVYAPAAQVGSFTIREDLVRRIPLTQPVQGGTVPGWNQSGIGSYSTDKWQVSGKSGTGNVRITFHSNDWSNIRVTVLGKNRGGYIAPWKAPSTWLCSGYKLQELRMGYMDADELFDALSGEASAMTWAIRVIGLALLWSAFCLVSRTFSVAFDWIPCIGPWLGDQVETVVCCASFFPACTCCLGVVGVVWVAVRPLIGVPLLLIFFGVFGYAAAAKSKQMQNPASMQTAQAFQMAMPSVDARVLTAQPSAPPAPHV